MHRFASLAVPASLCALLSLFPAPARAELKPLRESPPASVSLDIGVTAVRVDYHRPAVKGRVIWGGLVPYGQVWRAGANQATAVTTDGPVKIAGPQGKIELPAGRYGFFAIPGKDEWTLILSKQGKIWGAYAYNEAEDVLRIKVKPESVPPVEHLTYHLTPLGDEKARLALDWAGVRVGFDIEVDVHANYKKLVEAEIARAGDKPEDSNTYLQAALYYFKRNIELDKALAWTERSIKIGPSFWNYEMRARIHERTGKRDAAVADMTEALRLSRLKPFGKGGPPQGYIDNLEKDLAAWKAKK